MKNHKSPSKNQEKFVTIHSISSPSPEAFVDAFAAEADMSPESFAEMVVGHYQAP